MSKNHYGLVIDTTKYTGNFSRELGGYLTGVMGIGGIGSKFSSDAWKTCKSLVWLNDNLIKKVDSDDDYRNEVVYEIFKTDGAYNKNGNYHHGLPHNSIIIFLKQQPPVEVVEELFERANYFAKNAEDLRVRFGVSLNFNDYYSKIKGTTNTLDITGVRLFTVPTDKTFRLKDESFYSEIPISKPFMRSEKSFMIEHNLNKAKTKEEITHYKNKLNNLEKDNIELLNAYFSGNKEVYEQHSNKIMNLLYGIDYFIDKADDFQVLESLYKKAGVNIEIPKETLHFAKNIVIINHDGINYGVYQDRTNQDITEGLHHFNILKNRYHSRIKEIHDKIDTNKTGNIYVLAGIGGWVCVAFSNKSGIMAELACHVYNKADTHSDIFEKIISNKELVLTVKKKKNNKYFNMMNTPTLKVIEAVN